MRHETVFRSTPRNRRLRSHRSHLALIQSSAPLALCSVTVHRVPNAGYPRTSLSPQRVKLVRSVLLEASSARLASPEDSSPFHSVLSFPVSLFVKLAHGNLPCLCRTWLAKTASRLVACATQSGPRWQWPKSTAVPSPLEAHP